MLGECRRGYFFGVFCVGVGVMLGFICIGICVEVRVVVLDNVMYCSFGNWFCGRVLSCFYFNFIGFFLCICFK